MFAISPTDFALICKNIYSTSNKGNVLISIVPNVQAWQICFKAVVISSCDFDSNAINNTFSSFTRKGLYLTLTSFDGNVNSYVAVSIIGNAIISSPFYYILLINNEWWKYSTSCTFTNRYISSNFLYNSFTCTSNFWWHFW